MKIMSFNTQHCFNHLEKRIDYEIMAKTINAIKPDILGLNEMRNKGKSEEYLDQAAILSARTGMEYHYFAEAIKFEKVNPYGNALLSRLPILKTETIKIPDPKPRKYNGYYETRCVLRAKLEGGITVLVTHLGLNPDEQENAINTILPLIEKEKCILMGDFNITPDNALLNPIREKMVDTATLFETPKLSFPSDNVRVKIDYIFVSPDIKIKSADIPEIIASDHRPHIAVIEV